MHGTSAHVLFGKKSFAGKIDHSRDESAAVGKASGIIFGISSLVPEV
jgi:hypothetical protein